MFGGCLPVESTTDNPFFKTFGQLNGQREGNAKNNPKSLKEKVQEPVQAALINYRDKGQDCPEKASCPFILGGKEVCVVSLDILGARIRKKFY
ncbi:hypothetical protein [Cytobacillus oceanisediminis]|uniref:Uncharacterized protein n=1 Tax=Cytobacillus oceanisediminis TaxID=665099 RepID=A0A562JJ21_9BACI|nr:hypothetical protein IQ19_04025 [Cytobacillus oceanisediminis]